MIFTRINQIQHKPTRHVARAAVRAHLIFLKLVLLKTIIFNIAGLKAVVASSAFLMGVLNFIPHIEVVDASTPASIDMSISHTVYPVVTDTKEINVYMIYVQNETLGDSPSNVIVTATMPAGTTFDSASISPSSIDTDKAIVTWNLPNGDNEHVMILLRLLVDEDASGTLSSVATVTAANPDPYTSNNSRTASIAVDNAGSVFADVDLYITKQVDQSQASVTDELEYTITYGNNGTDTATNTYVQDFIPSNMYVVSASPEPTGMSGSSLIWEMDDLPGGMEGDITLTVSLYPLLEEGTTVTNHVFIDSDAYEEDIDLASASTEIIEGESQLYADIFTSEPEVCSGDTVEFVINFGNQGAAEANSVTITNDIPSALQYLYSSEPYSSVAGSEFTRNIAGQLFPGDQGSFTVTTKAISAGIGVTNIVVANEQGIPVASGAFSIDILTPEVCEYLGGGRDDDEVQGCTDQAASNYNRDATQDDGSCTYEEDDEEDEDPEPVEGLDGYNVTFDTTAPLLDNPVDLTIQLLPDDTTPASYTKSLTIQMQKKSGTKWTIADASDYTLTIPTVSATFTKTALRSKKWDNAITIKSAGNYRLKIFETANENALGYGYLTVASSTVARTGTGSTGDDTTTATDESTMITYLPGTNIGTGGTGAIPTTWRPIDASATTPTIPTTAPSIPKSTRPAATPKKATAVDPNNPFVRRNAGLTTAERRNQQEVRDAIKKATSTYTSAPVTCEDTYREQFEFAKELKLTNARSLDEFKPCDPISRIDTAKVAVLYLLSAAIVDPDLNTKMSFTDVSALNNEQFFYLNLFLDFRLHQDGKTFRPLENLKRQEAAVIMAKMNFGTEYIKSESTQYQDAMNLMHQALLMKDTTNGTADINKGDFFNMLYRSYFGDTLQSSRYITVIKNKK